MVILLLILFLISCHAEPKQSQLPEWFGAKQDQVWADSVNSQKVEVREIMIYCNELYPHDTTDCRRQAEDEGIIHLSKPIWK